MAIEKLSACDVLYCRKIDQGKFCQSQFCAQQKQCLWSELHYKTKNSFADNANVSIYFIIDIKVLYLTVYTAYKTFYKLLNDQAVFLMEIKTDLV